MEESYSYLNESLRKIAKGVGIVFIGTGMGMFFAYLGMMIVARFLGPTDFGLISLASAVATVASTVVMVGMPKGIERYIAFRIVFIGKTFYSSTTNNLIPQRPIEEMRGFIKGISAEEIRDEEDRF